MRVLIENTSASGMDRSQQKNDDRFLFDMVNTPGSFCLLKIKRLGPIGYLQYGITMCISRMVPSVVAEQKLLPSTHYSIECQSGQWARADNLVGYF